MRRYMINPFIGFLSKECFCFSLFTDTKDNDDMLEDEIDGDLHHSDDEDISNSLDVIKSRIPGIYPNSACPDERCHMLCHLIKHCPVFQYIPLLVSCFKSISVFLYSQRKKMGVS